MLFNLQTQKLQIRATLQLFLSALVHLNMLTIHYLYFIVYYCLSSVEDFFETCFIVAARVSGKRHIITDGLPIGIH